MLADFVLDHDIDPDDSYKVECLLRRVREQPHLFGLGDYPRLDKRLIAEVVTAVRQHRDTRCTQRLFEYINSNLPAWRDDNKVYDNLADEIADDIEHELRRIARERDDCSSIEPKIARYAALLLIQQAAWRKHDDELKASEQEFAAEEDLV
jgi:hypothetical protein